MRIVGGSHIIFRCRMFNITILHLMRFFQTTLFYKALLLATYLTKCFVYIVAIMDWYGRRVLPWRLSNNMDADFCTETLEEAIRRSTSGQRYTADNLRHCQRNQASRITLKQLPEICGSLLYAIVIALDFPYSMPDTSI